MIRNSQKVFTPLEKDFSVLLRYYTTPKNIDNIMPNPHFHEQYELVYVSSGSVIYKIENRVYKLKRGDFALIPPYVVHITEKKSELEMYIVNFTKNYIERYLNQVAVNSIFSSLTSRIYRSNNTPHVSDNNRYILRQIYDEYQKESKTDDNVMCPYLLFVLLQSIAKYSKAETPYESPTKSEIKKPLINLVLEYVDLYYAQITCLEDISNHFFISKAHLCKLFKKEIGYTAIQYLTNLKIKNAIELFKTTDYTSKKISESVGFESNSYFSRVFKEKTGYSPTEYREQVLSIDKDNS